jgi:peptidoglycan/LPS O-acetylase OafA/YrhL
VIIFTFNISVVAASLKYAKKRNLLEKKNAVMILKVNVISALLLIISVNHLEFMRLYRPIEILNYSVMGGLAAYNRRTHRYRLKPILYALLIMASGWLLCYRFILVDHYTDVIECILQQNLLFQ